MAADPRREGIEPGDLPDIPRPREQARFVGHAEAEAAFVAGLRSGRLHHAWLIGGPRGIGKASLAYRVARWLATHPAWDTVPDRLDVAPDSPAARQVAALSHPNLVALRRVQATGVKTMPTRITVDAARKALDLFETTAGNDGYRVCIVDSAEDLNPNSANALLKMLEEPPPRALFLIVSHAPGRLLPTIRSRCRRLLLRPLAEREVRAVIAGFPVPFIQPDSVAAARAAALSDGSVGRAVAMLNPDTAGLINEVGTLLAHLPAPDWRCILKLAETLVGREAEERFAVMLESIERFLSAEIDRRQGEGPVLLEPLVEAAERIARSAREAATYNLDRRPLVLSVFGELDAALRAAR